MSGIPNQAPGPQAQQALPEYMQNIRASQEKHEKEESGLQLDGCALPLNKFDVGASHFRVMPDHAAIQENLPLLQQGQNVTWEKGFAYATFDLYLPAKDDSDSKGMTLFPGAIKVSPATDGIPGAPATQIDPAQAFLEDPNYGKIRYKKKSACTPLENAIRSALFVRRRIVMQVVNYGKNGQAFHTKDDTLGVSALMVWDSDFHQSWRYYCFEEPFGHRRNVLDPLWYGVNLSVTREGTGQFDTSYGTIHAIYGPPYQQAGADFGYPMSMLADGSPDMEMIYKLLGKVVPWVNLFEWTTPDEIQNAMDELMPKLEQRFGQSQASVPAAAPGPAPTPGYGMPPQAPVTGQVASPSVPPAQPAASPPPPPAPGVPQQPQTAAPAMPAAPAQQPPMQPPVPGPQPGPAQAPAPPAGPAVPGAAPAFSAPVGQTAPTTPQGVPNVVGAPPAPQVPQQPAAPQPTQPGPAAQMPPQQAAQVAQQAAAPPPPPVAPTAPPAPQQPPY